MLSDGLKEPSWHQVLTPRLGHPGRLYGRGMLGVAEVEDVRERDAGGLQR